MASYLRTEEIKTSLRVLVNQYIEECRDCDKIPQDFIDLLRHNFLAKFVFYNKNDKTEIDMCKQGVHALLGAVALTTGTDVCSVPMFNCLIRNKSRFHFSHEF